MKAVLQTNATGKIHILLYHQVGTTPDEHTNLDCFCDSKEFYKQMRFLKESHYKIISLNQAVELILNKGVIDKHYVVLTFDDGCEKFYDTAFPVLEALAFPSTIYPVVNCLGKHATWGNLKNPALKILSRSMVTELCKLGVEIGAHTMDHVKLTRVDRYEAVKQVNESKKTLEQLTGSKVSSIAYPHGDFNQESIEIVQAAGFSNALTCIADTAEQAKSAYEIPRKYITYYDDLNQFKKKLL